MRGTVLYGPRDVRFEERPDAEDREADRRHHPDRGHLRVRVRPVAVPRHPDKSRKPTPMGHEYCGIVEEVGSAVTTVKPGQFVIGSFFASDNTCPNCQAGYQSSLPAPRVHRRRAGAAAARPARGRHAGRDAGDPAGRPDPEPADALRRAWAPAGSPPTRPT